jgi:hypothetical protein
MELNIQHVYDTKDGELCILINRVKYIYFLDAAILPRILKMIEKSPGRALKLIKNSARYFYKEEQNE